MWGRLMLHWGQHKLKRANVLCEGRIDLRGKPVDVRNEGSITLGEGVRIFGTLDAVGLIAAKGGAIKVGKRVLLNTGVRIYAESAVTIGDHCLIGNNSVLCDANFHAVHEGSAASVRPITLGRNVWLARGVVVLPGVSIGDHAVIAAGSVVDRDVPAKQLWRGNPATYVKDVRASDSFVRR
ncbi:acyltransferase [Sphingobium lignivorans]|uniref:Acetyltransferase-like isoleucine patch superfamily enzyme n=1 Tax=Sphingobium lignivorans TaxID=2735886 RepID=A0ABR6NJQ7_9SPHN|nr:acyltransferase [Sphingobium lignivorans]MBB5987513.1 acetyltransferase-like isoleucine patch superfamily enzyme [Sphingobium lignivorans]